MARKQTKRSQNFRKGFKTEDRDIQKDRSSRKPKADSANTRDWICSEGKPTNDPAWYVNNPVMSRDVGTLYFSRPTGAELPPSALLLNSSATRYDIFDPGILAIPSIITWGGTTPKLSPATVPMNQTAQKLYQFVVHANSRNTTYDKKDLIMSLMAIDSIYCIITEAIRAYRLIAQYDPQNRYVAKLLEAAKWDVDDLVTHVAEFRYTINWAITRVNKFFMPALFDMTKAHMAAYEHIYCDRPDLKGQFILKHSAGFWLYDDVSGSLEYTYSVHTASGLPLDWRSGRTVNMFREVVGAMIAAIEDSQYMGVMQGDMLKAFGMENMSNYAYLGIDMPITPVYDEEFNCKFHNADIASFLYENDLWVGTNKYGDANASCIIYRDTTAVDGNMICYSGAFNGTLTGGLTTVNSNSFWSAWKMGRTNMIDLPSGVMPSPENVILMSLYKQHPMYADSYYWRIGDANPITACVGDLNPEVLLRATLHYDPNDMSKETSVHTYAFNLFAINFMSRFATIPLITERSDTATSSNPIFWETNNVTPVDYDLLRRMNEVVFWSLWSNSTIATTDIVTRDTRV